MISVTGIPSSSLLLNVVGNLIALAAIEAAVRAALAVCCLALLIVAVTVTMAVAAAVSSGVRPESGVESIFQDSLLFQVYFSPCITRSPNPSGDFGRYS